MLTSSHLTAIAADLRSFEQTLLGLEEQLGSMLSAARTSVEDVLAGWSGPRSTATLGAIDAYVGSVGGVMGGGPAILAAVRGIVTRWATSADTLASDLSDAEALRNLAATTSYDDAESDRQTAQNRISEANSRWLFECSVYGADLDTYRAPLAGCLEEVAFSSSFPYPVLTGSEYTAEVAQFSIAAAIPISIIDPSGAFTAETSGRMDALFEEGNAVGNLVFTIIETAHEEDIGERDEHWSWDDLVAASDPELVREHIRTIYGEAGEPLDEAQLDALVNETVATALAIRASGSDDWEDRDEDLGFFEHGIGETLREDVAGPLTSIVVAGGCIAGVTAASGGTLTAGAAGGCVAAGGAAGRAVDSWANGGGFTDGLSAAFDPRHVAVDFVIGAGTQGLLNRFLPVGTTAPGGGAGPVIQGQAGVNFTVAQFEAMGARVAGTEVTMVTTAARTRIDLLIEMPGGQLVFVEVKTGASAALTANQRAAFPIIRAQGGTAVGARALEAGLVPGEAIGPTPVQVVQNQWPLP